MPTQTRHCLYRISRAWQTMSEKHRYVHVHLRVFVRVRLKPGYMYVVTHVFVCV